MDELRGIVEGMHNRIFLPNGVEESADISKQDSFYSMMSATSFRSAALSMKAHQARKVKQPQIKSRMTVIHEQNSNIEEDDD